jgi:hypothetical protein
MSFRRQKHRIYTQKQLESYIASSIINEILCKLNWRKLKSDVILAKNDALGMKFNEIFIGRKVFMEDDS